MNVMSMQGEKFSKALQILKLIGMILLFISGILIIYWIVKFIYDKFFKPNEEKTGTDEFANKQDLDTVKDEKEKQLKKGAKLSYPASYYHTLAKLIHERLNVVGRANYEGMYPLITKVKNYVDILALKSAFGLREFGVGYRDAIDLDTAIERESDYKTSALWKELNRAIAQNKKLTK